MSACTPYTTIRRQRNVISLPVSHARKQMIEEIRSMGQPLGVAWWRDAGPRSYGFRTMDVMPDAHLAELHAAAVAETARCSAPE
jgi:hypothetical protein